MKLLAVDLDNLDIAVVAGELATAALNSAPAPAVSCPIQWRVRQDAAADIVAIVACNTVTLNRMDPLGAGWPDAVSRLVGQLASRVWNTRGKSIEIEFAPVLPVPDSADMALLHLLDFTPGWNDEAFEEVVLWSRDRELRRRAGMFLPLQWAAQRERSWYCHWSGAEKRHVRTGSGRPGLETAAPVPAEWSAELPAGAPEFSLDTDGDVVRSSAAYFATELVARAHLLTQLSVSNASVCGVVRLARLLTQRDFTVKHVAHRDYVEVRNAGVPRFLSGSGALPSSSAMAGPGAIRFAGAGATASSRLPPDVYGWLCEQEAQLPVLRVSAGHSPALVCCDTSAFDAGGRGMVLGQVLEVSLAGRERNGDVSAVLFCPPGWWWLWREGLHFEGTFTTGIPARFFTSETSGAANAWISRDNLTLRPIPTGTTFARCPRALAPGDITSTPDLDQDVTHLTIAVDHLERGSSVCLTPIGLALRHQPDLLQRLYGSRVNASDLAQAPFVFATRQPIVSDAQ